MKYLCLVYQEEKEEVNVPKDVIEQAKRDYWAFTDDIQKSGKQFDVVDASGKVVAHWMKS